MALRHAAGAERARFAAALARHGFDICHGPFSTKWYNQELDQEQEQQPRDNNSTSQSLSRLPLGNAWLIGNTKQLWPRFLAWLETQPPHMRAQDPIDTYTTLTLERTVERHFHAHEDARIFHDYDRDPLVSMSRVADVSGLCFTHPTAFLSIHPAYGPWISLRAVVVVVAQDENDRACRPPRRLENPLSPQQDACVQTAAARVTSAASCSHDVDRVSTITDRVRPWIALRDAIPVGREYRFSEEQLWYHYLKDPEILERALTTRMHEST